MRWLLNLLLATVLVLGLAALFQAIRGGLLPSPLDEPQETPPPYPPPTGQDFGETPPYPPPGGTQPAEEVIPTFFLPQPAIITPFLIELTPGVPVLSTGTPVPTFTPFSSPTSKPGLTSTPIPLVEPAKDASGSILYFTEQDDGLFALQLLNVNAAGEAIDSPQKLISGLNGSEGTVFAAPDGSKLANTGMWGSGAIVSVEAGIQEPIYALLHLDQFFYWFPDNHQVLFRADGGSLRLGDPITGDKVLLSVPGYGSIDGAAAAPDGQKIVYSYNRSIFSPTSIWTVNSDGREAQFLFELASTATRFSWSPDGKTIAFLGDGYMVMDADGSNLRQLGNFPIAQGYELPPLWSPDSSTLAIVMVPDDLPTALLNWDENVFKGTDILLVDVASGKSRPLLPDGSTGNIDPAWSPDGSKIAFISNRSGTSEVWIVNADGSELRQLTNEGSYLRFPVWRRP